MPGLSAPPLPALREDSEGVKKSAPPDRLMFDFPAALPPAPREGSRLLGRGLLFFSRGYAAGATDFPSLTTRMVGIWRLRRLHRGQGDGATEEKQIKRGRMSLLASHHQSLPVVWVER